MTAAVAEPNAADGFVACVCGSDRAGVLLRAGVRLTVGLLAAVAAGSSFGHMNELAIRHGQAGWQSLVFPVCVDGVEVVATLVLLLEHRQRGKATSALAWFALAVGTAASVGANITVGPPDLIGKAISGWPAVALILSLKLLTMAVTMKPAASPHCLLHSGDVVSAGAVDGGLALAGSPALGSGRPAQGSAVQPAAAAANSATGPSLNGHVYSVPAELGAAGHPSGGDSRERTAAPVGIPGDDCTDVAEGGGAPGERADSADSEDPLLAASRAIRDRLEGSGERLTRQKLLQLLRAGGFTVSNERAGEVLRALRVEVEQASAPGTGPASRATGP